MNWKNLVMLLVCLTILTAGCAGKTPPLRLPEIIVPDEPVLHTKPLTDPKTGKPGVFFPLEHAAQEGRYREDLRGAALQGKANTDAANKLLEKLRP
jgi:hypothetical protein